MLSACISGNRGFYDLNKSEFNQSRAVEQLKQLKNGVLIVSIPTDRQKINLLKNTNKKQYKKVAKEIAFARENMMIAMSRFYKFSEYIFIADSSLVSFTNKNDKTHFISPTGESMETYDIDTSSTFFVLKDIKDYDHLFIFDKYNNYPSRPFPYESSLNVRGKKVLSFDYFQALDIDYQTRLSQAIYILSKRLEKRGREWHLD